MTQSQKIAGLKKVIKILDAKRGRVAGLGSSVFILNEILIDEQKNVKKGLKTREGFGHWYKRELHKARKMFAKPTKLQSE